MDLLLNISGVLLTYAAAAFIYGLCAAICVAGAALLTGLFCRYVL